MQFGPVPIKNSEKKKVDSIPMVPSSWLFFGMLENPALQSSMWFCSYQNPPWRIWKDVPLPTTFHCTQGHIPIVSYCISYISCCISNLPHAIIHIPTIPLVAPSPRVNRNKNPMNPQWIPLNPCCLWLNPSNNPEIALNHHICWLNLTPRTKSLSLVVWIPSKCCSH